MVESYIDGKTEELGEKPVPVPLTWIDPGANPGLCSERPATNDLSHGTALVLNVRFTIVMAGWAMVFSQCLC
jgi:hypothetical protein